MKFSISLTPISNNQSKISFRWFEFSISFYLTFGISIEIGIYAGPFKITLYKFSEGAEVQLLPTLELKPRLEDKDSIGALDGHAYSRS